MAEDYRYPIRPGEPGVPIDPAEMRPVTELFVQSTITSAPAHARATDSRGSVQPREAVWNPGFLHNSWHSVEIEVTR